MKHEGHGPVVTESAGAGEVGSYRATLADLPPALDTGNALIDDEHRLLLSVMRNVRSICLDPARFSDCLTCPTTRQAVCERDLVGMLGDLFSFILDHFSTEERIMRDSMMLLTDHDLCEAHVEDHAAIAQKVQEIVSRLDTEHTVERIRELDDLLARWIENHIGLHDLMPVRWLNSEDGARLESRLA